MNRNVGGFSNCRRFRTFLTLISMGMTRVFIASQNSDTDFVDAIGCLRHAGTLLITADLGDATALTHDVPALRQYCVCIGYHSPPCPCHTATSHNATGSV